MNQNEKEEIQSEGYSAFKNGHSEHDGVHLKLRHCKRSNNKRRISTNHVVYY